MTYKKVKLGSELKENEQVQVSGYLVRTGSHWALAPSQKEKDEAKLYLSPEGGTTLCQFIDLVYPRKGVKDGVQAPEKDSDSRNITVQGTAVFGGLMDVKLATEEESDAK